MADDELGAMFTFFGMAIVIAVAVGLILFAASAMAGAGALVGGVTAVRNYVLSFRDNVKFECI